MMRATVLNSFDHAAEWLSGAIGDPVAKADLTVAARARIRARQVQAILQMTPALMAGNIVCALAFLIVLGLTGQSSLVAAIWAAIAIAAALHTLWRWFRLGAHSLPDQISEHTVRRLVGNVAIMAAIWAMIGPLLLPYTSGSAQAFVVAMMAGLIAGGTMALYPIAAAATVYAATVSLGGMIGFATFCDSTSIGFFLVSIGFLWTVTQAIKRHSALFVAEYTGQVRLAEQKQMIEELLQGARAEADEERTRSRLRLAQAQKMEAVGQLTAGVAHDFNNLLAAIQGHAELMEIETKQQIEPVNAILRSVQRGADLVKQLLSIGRRQHLKPENLDPGRLIARMASLLERTLAPNIAIGTDVPPAMPLATADRAQLDAALLSLALNARDAMPDGGSLAIACRRVAATDAELRSLDLPAAPFVCISMEDTGHGMSEDIRERAIEPFFTTRQFGAGGLGLSAVHGFAEQSNGRLTIESQAGQGTRVSIYLPAVADTVVDDGVASTVPLARGERILVVADQSDVRHATVNHLQSLGYTALHAGNLDQALACLAANGSPDLVLTDVLLSNGMTGYDLSAKAAGQRFAYMSGYSANASPMGALKVSAPVLRKPFTRAALATFVRDSLDKR